MNCILSNITLNFNTFKKNVLYLLGTRLYNPGINIINNSIYLLYKCIHLINKPDRKKYIIWIEFTESLYKINYNTF